MSAAEVTLESRRQTLGDLGREAARLFIVDLDLVFVMDTTGSMRSELADIQVSLLGIIRVLHRLAPSLSVGFVGLQGPRRRLCHPGPFPCSR